VSPSVSDGADHIRNYVNLLIHCGNSGLVCKDDLCSEMISRFY